MRFIRRVLCITYKQRGDYDMRFPEGCSLRDRLVLALRAPLRRPSAGSVQELGRDLVLVVRIARPTSLAIWHRGRSHRRPNRSGSPNRRHFASLDLQKHANFSHRRPTSQDFCRRFFWHFPVISDQANVFSHR